MLQAGPHVAVTSQHVVLWKLCKNCMRYLRKKTYMICTCMDRMLVQKLQYSWVLRSRTEFYVVKLSRKLYMLWLDSVQHTNNFWQLLQVHSVLNCWEYIQIHLDTYMKDVAWVIKNWSHAMSRGMWACHLYPVAVGPLPAVQWVTNKKFRSLIFSVIYTYSN